MEVDVNKNNRELVIKKEDSILRNFSRLAMILINAAILYQLFSLEMTYVDYAFLAFLPVFIYTVYVKEFKLSYQKEINLEDIDFLLINRFFNEEFYYLQLKNGKARQLSGFDNYEKRRAFALLDDVAVKTKTKRNKLVF